MRSTKNALRKVLALSLLLGAGGCVVLGYDFDKKPPSGCVTAADCPGIPTACGAPVCDQGSCKFTNVRPEGELPPGQDIGDCRIGHCDGQGNLVFEADPTDLPNDGNECTEDTCVQGTPKNDPSNTDKPCGVKPGLTCNGAGVCNGCLDAMDCGADTPCVKWACDMEGKCSRALEPVGTVGENPLPGDCKASLCDAKGNLQEKFFQGDPADDGDDCTVGVCMTDGTTMQNAAPNGTPCGGAPCMACTAGKCGACDEVDYTCNMDKCTPLKKLPVGSACQASIDCLAGNCVDGVCCDGPCGGTCRACSNEKTGQPNGTCAPVPDGSDPDNDCSSPVADVCVGGTCQCYNGAQDGGEIKVDCGGNCNPCPGKWVCKGKQGCTGADKTFCCYPVCIACNDGEVECKAIEGTACPVGEKRTFYVREHNGTCEQCGAIECSCL